MLCRCEDPPDDPVKSLSDFDVADVTRDEEDMFP